MIAEIYDSVSGLCQLPRMAWKIILLGYCNYKFYDLFNRVESGQYEKSFYTDSTHRGRANGDSLSTYLTIHN